MSRFAALTLLALLIHTPQAAALMAGSPPDTPEARVIPAAELDDWPGLGQVITPGGRFGGVAVSPRHILTATHVAAAARQAPDTVRFIPAAHPNDERAVARIEVLPGYAMPANDLAMLVLAEPLPGRVSIAHLLGRPVSAGETVELAGAGVSGHGGGGPSRSGAPGVFRWGQNVVDLVGAHVPGVQAAGDFLFYDFDGPTGTGVVGGPSLGNDRETLVAGGDSGTPIYLAADGTEPRQLVGISTAVVSGTAQTRPAFRFGDMGIGTDLTAPRVRAWLSETAEGAIREGTSSGWATSVVALLGVILLVGAIALALSRRRAQRGGRAA